MIQFNSIEIGFHSPLISIPHLELKHGEIYALIGANGTGKSTLLQTILKKTKPLTGEIQLNSLNIQTLTQKEMATKIAFVESKFDGIEHLSVYDYVALGRTPYSDILGRLTQKDHTIIEGALNSLNLADFPERQTLELSDGERQMVAIARALAQTTELILLDEPTAFLDYGNRFKLIQRLKTLAKTEGKTILFSTHDIDLCLEEKLALLVINQKTKNLEQLASGCLKSLVLETGFNS